jgi:hypothetical protein
MLTRRDFMTELAVAGAALATIAVLPAKIFAAAAPARGVSNHAVVSIHLDQPYLDATGRALPYVPPDGLRGGAPIAHLSEAEFRTQQISC